MHRKTQDPSKRETDENYPPKIETTEKIAGLSCAASKVSVAYRISD